MKARFKVDNVVGKTVRIGKQVQEIQEVNLSCVPGDDDVIEGKISLVARVGVHPVFEEERGKDAAGKPLVALRERAKDDELDVRYISGREVEVEISGEGLYVKGSSRRRVADPEDEKKAHRAEKRA